MNKDIQDRFNALTDEDFDNMAAKLAQDLARDIAAEGRKVIFDDYDECSGEGVVLSEINGECCVTTSDITSGCTNTLSDERVVALYHDLGAYLDSKDLI